MPLASVKVSCKGRLLALPNVDQGGRGDHDDDDDDDEKEEEEENYDVKGDDGDDVKGDD